MKIKQIKGIKYKQFEEEELREKLGMSEDNIKIVLDYQVKFPQLTICNEDGFCIDGELLCKELGVKDDYNNWLLRTTKGKEGKLIKYRCIENTDFKTDWIFPNANKYSFSNEDMVNMSSQKRSSYGIKNKITLTLKCAKKIAMRQNNNQGDLVCDYFILVESTLKDYEEWEKVRFPEKQNANLLKRELKKWASKNFMDFNDKNLKTINDTKVIYNPSIARQLLHRGNKIIDIKPDKKDKFKSNFIFNCTDKLLEDLSSITKR